MFAKRTVDNQIYVVGALGKRSSIHGEGSRQRRDGLEHLSVVGPRWEEANKIVGTGCEKRVSLSLINKINQYLLGLHK